MAHSRPVRAEGLAARAGQRLCAPVEGVWDRAGRGGWHPSRWSTMDQGDPTARGGALGPVFCAINQIFIFAPLLLVVVLRRQSWATAWLPRRRIAVRLLLGLVLASLTVSEYSVLRAGADAPWVLWGRIWRYEHFDEMVQVLLEDLTIAILFVRLAGAIGSRWATVIVACLFAAGHIPVMLSHGATWNELGRLLGDAGLGVAVILVLQQSRDVAWFWCIHCCLDMTQFSRISGVG